MIGLGSKMLYVWQWVISVEGRNLMRAIFVWSGAPPTLPLTPYPEPTLSPRVYIIYFAIGVSFTLHSPSVTPETPNQESHLMLPSPRKQNCCFDVCICN